MSLLGQHDNHQVVVTEDALSAAKVSRHTHAWPALGTQFQLHKLVYLQKRGFQEVVVWLDADKWREGREICEKAQWMGLSARAIYSEHDPKSYSDEQILEYLK